MLKTFVKIGAINNLSDARYCAGMMVDHLGFKLNNSEMTPSLFKDIVGWIEGVQIVGEFDKSCSITDIKTTLLAYEVDIVQVENPELLDELIVLDYPLAIKLSIEDHKKYAETYKDNIAYFILDDEQANWDILDKIKHKEQTLLASLIDPSGLDKVLEMGFKGIEMKGGEEQRPGVKDFDDLADILELLEVD